MHRVIAAAALTAALVACGSENAGPKPRGPHWNDKALASARAAEKRAGGFNASDRAAYKRGLQHIINAHQRVGAFTIAELVDDEYRRENARNAVLQTERERARTAAKIAAYARDLRLMIQLDSAGVHEMAQAARAYNMADVYTVASEGLRGVDMLGGLAAKKPDGFDRTQEAAEAYRDNMRERYEAARDMANDQSPKSIYAFRVAVGSDYGARYVAALLKAFDADVDGAGLDSAMRARLKARLRSG
jgi:hypothetical protein